MFFPRVQLKFASIGQIMAWHRAGHKPLSEPMMAYFTDTYVSLGLSELHKELPPTTKDDYDMMIM